MIFHMRVAEMDSSGYYYARWDQATAIAVRADTKADAYEEVWRVMGKARNGWHWEAKLDRIQPEPIAVVANLFRENADGQFEPVTVTVEPA